MKAPTLADGWFVNAVGGLDGTIPRYYVFFSQMDQIQIAHCSRRCGTFAGWQVASSYRDPDLVEPGLNGGIVGYDPTTLAAMNQTITGARMGRAVLARDIPWLIGHWRSGRLKLAELVSGRYRLEEINQAIAATRSGAARRSVILFE